MARSFQRPTLALPSRALAGLAVSAAVTIGLSSCIPSPALAPFAAGDMRPPAVDSWGPTGARELVIAFDEELAEAVPGFASSPGPSAAGARVGDDRKSVVVALDGAQVPGARYAVSGMVADAAGNISSFVLPYWGYNPKPPRMLVNELLTEGSAAHPDAIELYVVSEGDCAGSALFLGSPDSFDVRYVFPPLPVAEGDYLVLHLKPQGLPEEKDETGDKAESGGIDATPSAWDLWYRGGDGALPGKNGAVALCLSPVGAIVDAVAYSERSADSDSKYGGFGSAALRDRVGALVAAAAWTASDPPRPEDCARSTGTTSTRTLCRSSASADADSGADWHVAPTKGATLGGPNGDEAYAP